MTSETYTAGTQYNDFLGTVAADNADQNCFYSWLKEEDLVKDNEYLVGVTMYTSDSFIEDDDSAWVSLFLENSEDETIRKVKIDMSIEEFFSHFKRFEIMISCAGRLTDQEIEIEETLDLNEQEQDEQFF